MPIRITSASFVTKDAPSAWVSELDHDPSVSRHSSWVEFEEASRNVQIAAIFAPVLDDAIARRIAALRADRPALPLVIVALLTDDNSRALNRLPRFERVLLDGEVVGQLRVALKDAAAYGLLLRAAAWLEVQTELPKLFRESLAAACRKGLPVRTVNALSTTVLGDKRQAFWELWHECMPANVTPRSFVDWLLVRFVSSIRLKR